MKKLILTIMAGGLAATTFAHGGMGSCSPQGSILLYGVGTYTNTHGTNTSKFSNTNSSTIDQPRELNWVVSPGVGFNITDYLTVGVDFNYTGSKTTYDRKGLTSPNGTGTISLANPAIDQVKTYEYGIGPFVRYTCPISEHFFVFGQFTAHYLRGRVANRYVTATVGGSNFTSDDDSKGLDASFVPVIGAMVTKSLGLTFSVGGVGYEYRKYDLGPVNYGYFQNGGVYPAAGSTFEAKTNDFAVTFGHQFNFGIQKYFGCGMSRHHMSGAEPMDETRQMDTSDDSNSDDSNSDNGGKKRKHRRHRKNDDE